MNNFRKLMETVEGVYNEEILNESDEVRAYVPRLTVSAVRLTREVANELYTKEGELTEYLARSGVRVVQATSTPRNGVTSMLLATINDTVDNTCGLRSKRRAEIGDWVIIEPENGGITFLDNDTFSTNFALSGSLAVHR